ncbi:MAG: DUF4013 domain-containing protein [Candidatus Methanofastidiosum sp.]|nr:DUF4013 domain-containing protein [Methanofastidiosum sp.]
MFIDGLKVFVVGIIYTIIPLIIQVAGIFSVLHDVFSGYVTNPIQSGGSRLIIRFHSSHDIGFLLAMAPAHMAFNDGQFDAAFWIREMS